MDKILKYFPALTEKQISQFAHLQELYVWWNNQINVISRKDMDNFYLHHVLHSLGIACVMPFADGTKVIDIGTGGGFPGIPLAIMFPETSFFLVDSIGKKIKVVNEIASAINLENVSTAHQRAEDVKQQFDFVVSRAVTALPEFLKWTQGKILSQNKNQLPNGLLYLKGGDLSDELSGVKKKIQIFELKDYFAEDFFDTKKVVYTAL
jgi:16S rRNA (guanine527-N7)-methyltransferase